ncbi:MAG: 50S ribosomal protein L9 [Gammaproteobacteria bacterium]|nr:50S ribosomal protein L9 [Gammaproteobacteria bacterium]
MNIILLEQIGRLGEPGDEVRVKAGYARNYLFPQGKALPANKENRAEFEGRRAQIEAEANKALAEARGRASGIEGAVLEIHVRASEEGKLFGSVNAADIEEAAGKKGLELQRSEVHLPDGPIKEIGDHEILVSLHAEVDCHITVSVLAEGGE